MNINQILVKHSFSKLINEYCLLYGESITMDALAQALEELLPFEGKTSPILHGNLPEPSKKPLRPGMIRVSRSQLTAAKRTKRLKSNFSE